MNGDAPQRFVIHAAITVLTGTSQPPFGAIDGPPEGAVIAGATQVAGWALDDVFVTDVAICQDRPSGMSAGRESDASCGSDGTKLLLGHAIFSDGGRPDIEHYAPTAPLNTRSPWAFVLDPATMPADARSAVRLYAMAHDVEGHSALLGSRLVTVKPPPPAVSFWKAPGPKLLALVLFVFGALQALVWSLFFRKEIPWSPSNLLAVPVTQPARARECAVVLLILGTFVWLNVPWMTRGLGYDELYHLGYSVLAGIAVRIFGTAEWVLRLPALMLGCVTIYMLWRFARTFSSPLVAMLSAATLALLPSAGGAGLAVDWARQDAQAPPESGYRSLLAARNGEPALRTFAIRPDRWNSPDERQMAVTLDRRCTQDDRGGVIVFICGQYPWETGPPICLMTKGSSTWQEGPPFAGSKVRAG